MQPWEIFLLVIMGLFSAETKGGELASLFKNATKKEVLTPQVTENAAAKSNSEGSESESAGPDSSEAGESDIESEDNNDSVQDEKPSKKRREDEDDLEEEYFSKLLGAESADQSKSKAAAGEAKTKAKSKSENEEESAKNEKTVFVGNVSSRVVSDRQIAKQFKQLFAKVGPVASVRFRSIAFSEQLPRRAAYIKQKVHEKRDSVNAYVVFKSAESSVEACKLNGEEFDDHHLRVDHVANPAEQNRKRSVFVGNLDFEATEESLYRHFMGCGPIEYVRIVRDNKTNFGKGFAYVQFKDTAAMPAALLLNDQDFNGRKLRVTHSKQHTSKPTANKEPERRSKNHQRGGAKGSVRPKMKAGEVFEGTRAKTGDKVGLGRKRKARTGGDQKPARKRTFKKSKKD